MLSILAVLAVSSLGFPRYSWRQASHRPDYIRVCNYIDQPVNTQYFPGQPSYRLNEAPRGWIEPGQCEEFSHIAENGDLKFTVNGDDWQAELSHNAGPDNYDFALKGITNDFPGHAVGKCGDVSVYYRPGGEATCSSGTPIQVDLLEGEHRRVFGVPYYYRAGWY